MNQARVIPCLLISGNSLVKTRKFKKPVYIGDPVNAIRIFSEKEVDELIIVDIDASKEGREPNFDLIEEMAGEAFMPVAYGGGVKNLSQARRLIRAGVEKIVVNTAAFSSTALIREIVDVYGSQAVIGAIDVKKKLLGSYRLMSASATEEHKTGLLDHIDGLIQAGVGEIFVNDIERDGLMEGYDIELMKSVARHVNVPVIACGGAGNIEHLKSAILDAGVSAVAAGSMFVFYGRHKAVLINYLNKNELKLISELTR